MRGTPRSAFSSSASATDSAKAYPLDYLHSDFEDIFSSFLLLEDFSDWSEATGMTTLIAAAKLSTLFSLVWGFINLSQVFKPSSSLIALAVSSLSSVDDYKTTTVDGKLARLGALVAALVAESVWLVGGC